jgi:hypothetical protein
MNLGILGQGLCGIGAGVSTDPAAQAWANQVVTNGGTVSAGRLALVSTMIAGLKTDTVWPLIDRFIVTAAEGEIAARTDMVAPSTAITKNGSPAFTIDRGYIAITAATDYLADASYNFSTATNFKQNSSHMMVYVNQSAGNQANPIAGASDGTTNNYMNPKFTDNKFYAALNAPGPNGITVASALGCSIGSRTDNATTELYKNTTDLGAITIGDTSVAIVSSTLQLLRASSQSSDTSNRLAAFSVGGTLSPAQALSLNNRITTFLTAIGGQ